MCLKNESRLAATLTAAVAAAAAEFATLGLNGQLAGTGLVGPLNTPSNT